MQQPNQLDSREITLVLKEGKEIKAVMRPVMEYIRCGNVTALASENAEDLIKAADYFLLPELKTDRLKYIVANLLEPDLSIWNCISSYCFAEKHLTEDDVAKYRNFIISDFAAVAECQEEFVNLESQQVERMLQIPETVVRRVQEFSRSGEVAEATSENAADLIEAADYFLLSGLTNIVSSRQLE